MNDNISLIKRSKVKVSRMHSWAIYYCHAFSLYSLSLKVKLNNDRCFDLLNGSFITENSKPLLSPLFLHFPLSLLSQP